jgi:hypothetical protein
MKKLDFRCGSFELKLISKYRPRENLKEAGVKEPDRDFAELRKQAIALPEPCGYCHAKTGERCVHKKTGIELEMIPAHYARLRQIGFPRKVVTP